MKIFLLIIIALVYIIYTFKYAFVLKNSLVYKGKSRILHQVLIWLIPFVWVWLLKSLSKSTPGSFEIENKVDPIPFSNSGGVADVS